MTTNHEKNVILAQLCGYRHVTSDDFIYGPDGNVVVWMNYKGNTVLVGEPYRVNITDEEVYSHSFREWSPTENDTDALDVLLAIRHRITVNIRYDSHSILATLIAADGDVITGAIGNTFHTAVCTAILRWYALFTDIEMKEQNP